jgi:hypothetical protein
MFFSLTAVREWAAGRWWWWRAPILLFFVAQALRPLREQGEWTLFSGIIFGAHEFGHLFWMFFGEWMGVAGGSLTQLLIPIGAAAVVLRSRDWFGVAICGVFLATSLGELSWYIDDARRLDLDLVSFSEDGGIHDWNYLLNSVGLIRHDRAIAGLTRLTGIVVLLASFVFALQLLWWMATLKPADAPGPSPDA